MGRKKNPDGIGTNIKLPSAEDKQPFTAWCIDNHMELGVTAALVLNWFVRSDPLVQAVVVGRVIPRLKNAHAAALRQLADEMDGADKLTIVTDITAPTASSPQARKAEKASHAQNKR